MTRHKMNRIQYGNDLKFPDVGAAIMNEAKVILVYIGRDTLMNVPARDLTEQDFKDRAEQWQEAGWNEESLVGTGLYQYATETAQAHNFKPGDERAEFQAPADFEAVNVYEKPKGKKKEGE